MGEPDVEVQDESARSSDPVASDSTATAAAIAEAPVVMLPTPQPQNAPFPGVPPEGMGGLGGAIGGGGGEAPAAAMPEGFMPPGGADIQPGVPPLAREAVTGMDEALAQAATAPESPAASEALTGSEEVAGSDTVVASAAGGETAEENLAAKEAPAPEAEGTAVALAEAPFAAAEAVSAEVQAESPAAESQGSTSRPASGWTLLTIIDLALLGAALLLSLLWLVSHRNQA